MAFCPALFCPPSVRSLSDASEELVWRSGYACDWWGPSGIDSVHASNGGEKKPTYFIAINWPQLQYSGQCFSIWPASSYQEAAEIRRSPSQIHRMVKARAQLFSSGPVGGLLHCSLVPAVLASCPNYPCKQWCLQKGHMIYGLASRNRLSLNILEIPHVKESQLNDWATAAQAEALPCSIVWPLIIFLPKLD